MASGEHPSSKLGIRFISKSIIKAANSITPQSVLPVSNFDHLSGRYPVTIFYAYSKPSTGNFNSVVNTLKTSLAETLDYFFPLAGRIVPNPQTGEPEILCNNEGIELIEASDDVSITSLNFHDMNDSIKGVMLPFTTEIHLSVQVTGYACGGFSIASSFDHLLADGNGFIKFLFSWSELAGTGRILAMPNHDRSIFRPRSPPSYGPLLDRTFTACTLHDVLAMPRNDISLKRMYYIDGSCIDRLQASVREGGGVERTRTEAVSAYLWKVLARSLGESDTECRMGWLVDGRPWMVSEPDGDCISSYRERGVDGGRGGEHEGVEGRISLVRGGDGGTGDSRGEEQGSFLGAVGLDRVLSAGDGAGEDSTGSPGSGDGGVVVSQYATDGYRLRIWFSTAGYVLHGAGCDRSWVCEPGFQWKGGWFVVRLRLHMAEVGVGA